MATVATIIKEKEIEEQDWHIRFQKASRSPFILSDLFLPISISVCLSVCLPQFTQQTICIRTHLESLCSKPIFPILSTQAVLHCTIMWLSLSTTVPTLSCEGLHPLVPVLILLISQQSLHVLAAKPHPTPTPTPSVTFSSLSSPKGGPSLLSGGSLSPAPSHASSRPSSTIAHPSNGQVREGGAPTTAGAPLTSIVESGERINSLEVKRSFIDE